ncbi:MAG: hypothetical protein KC766_10965 [Myxococcales bacterium]|nr:hypothetical protein [Myxococcales bacterium]
MADLLREDSLLFSLKSLQRMEKERADRELIERERRLAEQHQRRVLEEQRQRDAEKRRTEAQAARREAEQLRRAEEQARLEALKRAECERVVLESKLRAQLAVAEAERAHEVRLAEIRADNENRVAKVAASLLAGLAILLTSGTFGLYFGKLEPEHSEAVARLQRQLDTKKTDAKRLREDLDDVKAQLQTEQAESARLKRQRDDAQRQLSLAGDSTAAAKPRARAGTKGPTAPIARNGGALAKCKPGEAYDPMSFCLP